MAITKASIFEEVQKKNGLSTGQSIEFVELLLETMKSTLDRGEKLKISGFGNFTPRDKKTRIGRNPKTGAPVEIAARRVVLFKASPVLKSQMNKVAGGEV